MKIERGATRHGWRWAGPCRPLAACLVESVKFPPPRFWRKASSCVRGGFEIVRRSTLRVQYTLPIDGRLSFWALFPPSVVSCTLLASLDSQSSFANFRSFLCIF